MYKDTYTHKYVLVTIIIEETLNLRIREGTWEELKRRRNGENYADKVFIYKNLQKIKFKNHEETKNTKKYIWNFLLYIKM